MTKQPGKTIFATRLAVITVMSVSPFFRTSTAARSVAWSVGGREFFKNIFFMRLVLQYFSRKLSMLWYHKNRKNLLFPIMFSYLRKNDPSQSYRGGNKPKRGQTVYEVFTNRLIVNSHFDEISK